MDRWILIALVLHTTFIVSNSFVRPWAKPLAAKISVRNESFRADREASKNWQFRLKAHLTPTTRGPKETLQSQKNRFSSSFKLNFGQDLAILGFLIVALPLMSMTTRQDLFVFVVGALAGAASVYLLLQEKKIKDDPLQPDQQSTTSPSVQNNDNLEFDRKQALFEEIERPTLSDWMKRNDNKLEVQAIGEVKSVYKLCVGTPRQGLLAPHARGRIDLIGTSPDAVDGLDEYSHVWIFFVFHLNLLPSRHGKKPAKIAPPALGGRKVGVLATRSPHRPNPVGVTLARIDKIQVSGKSASIFLSGIDLVDGTPVLDIKPFVPTYDSAEGCHVPDWVSGGLTLRRNVIFSTEAIRQLNSIIKEGKDLKFYGRHGETPEEALSNVKECIEEVLSIDVRSQWQTKKARKGKSKAERAQRLANLAEKTGISDEATTTTSTQQIDNLLIRFQVQQCEGLQRETSRGSGAEDEVLVKEVLYTPQ